MSAHAVHQDDSGLVMNQDFEPVIVSFDVENDPVIRKKARVPIPRFYVQWTLPLRVSCFCKPAPQLGKNVGMRRAELFKFIPGDYLHVACLCVETYTY